MRHFVTININGILFVKNEKYCLTPNKIKNGNRKN
jgi:hypothetical protein